ncbi:MAG TPA: hypothetical protein VG389_28390 [Myxococcota bacterium]|jgi:hypothetical protein|nr:hypothetical protein [Myxococcota bacterium]
MRRYVLIALLTLGTLGGYAAGVRSLMYGGSCGGGGRDAFERHVAAVCVDAARDSLDRDEVRATRAARAAAAALAAAPGGPAAAPLPPAPPAPPPPPLGPRAWAADEGCPWGDAAARPRAPAGAAAPDRGPAPGARPVEAPAPSTDD